VFSRVGGAGADLADASSGFENLKGDLQLEVVIRRTRSIVGIAGRLLRRVEKTSTGTISSAVGADQQLKARYPDKLAATILAEPDTPYEPWCTPWMRVRRGESLPAGRSVRSSCSRRSPSTRRPRAKRDELSPIQSAPSGPRETGPGRPYSFQLIDIFTILIFFLLANASDVEVLPTPRR